MATPQELEAGARAYIALVYGVDCYANLFGYEVIADAEWAIEDDKELYLCTEYSGEELSALTEQAIRLVKEGPKNEEPPIPEQIGTDGVLALLEQPDTEGSLEGFKGDINQRIIAALLCSSGIKQAAEFAGVSRTTVYNKLKNDEFLKQLESEKGRLYKLVRETIAQNVTEGAQDAITALRQIARGEGGFFDSPSPKDRMQAAALLLSIFTELNVEV